MIRDVLSLLDLDPAALAAVPATPMTRARRAVAVLHHVASYSYPRGASRVAQRLVTVPRYRHGDQRRSAHTFRVLVDDLPHPGPIRTEVDCHGNTVLHVEVRSAASRVAYETRALVTRDLAREAVRPGWLPTAASADDAGPLTTPGPALAAAADDVPAAPPLDLAVTLMNRAAAHVAYSPGVTTVHTSAEEAWALRSGVCQDLAHVLIALCRHRGIPARYVSGHLVGEGASHAWMEVGDPATGQVLALDPTHDRRTDLRYLTVAVGRDYTDVAPTHGTAWTGGWPGQLAIDKTFRIVATG